MNIIKKLFNINEDQTVDDRTATQKKQLTIALQAGKLRELAIARGATGYLRSSNYSESEMQRRKNRKRMVKQSRKANRNYK